MDKAHVETDWYIWMGGGGVEVQRHRSEALCVFKLCVVGGVRGHATHSQLSRASL